MQKITDTYKNFRVEPSEVAYKIYAINEKNGREELIKCMLNKACAYAYVSKANNVSKHRIHSNNLKVILLNRNMTAKQLSLFIGREEDTVKSWINNRTQPAIGSQLLICRYLGISREELVNF